MEQEQALRRAEQARQVLENEFLWEVVDAVAARAQERALGASNQEQAWEAVALAKSAAYFKSLLRAVVSDGHRAVEALRAETERLRADREARYNHQDYLAQAAEARQEWGAAKESTDE